MDDERLVMVKFPLDALVEKLGLPAGTICKRAQLDIGTSQQELVMVLENQEFPPTTPGCRLTIANPTFNDAGFVSWGL